MLNKFIINKVNDKVKIIIAITNICLFLFLEIISVLYFKVERHWDFKWIMDSAEQLSRTGTTENAFYFAVFPNNIGALVITTVAMFIAGGNEVGAYIANIIFVLLSFIFLALSAKKIGGIQLAINAELLMLLCFPSFLYTPIVYTDTLSIFIPILTLYLWLMSKDEENEKKKYILFILMAITGIVGYSIKPVAMIVYIAIIIETLFLNKKNLKYMLVSLSIFVILFTSYKVAINKLIIKDSQYPYPYTHWIMMGLNKPESEGGSSIGYGAYSEEDSSYTGSKPTVEERKNANILKIKERLNNFGVIGYIDFLFKKFEYVWNDGTYFVFKKISWDTINKDNLLYDYVIGEKSKIINQYLSYYHGFIMLMILIGLGYNIRTRKDDFVRVMGISMVGIALFLLVWEARSRYIYFMIPIFCLLAAINIKEISNWVDKKEKIKHE